MRAVFGFVAVVCYAAFFASFVYLIGFVAGLAALPTHVDANPLWSSEPPLAMALGIDLALIALFGFQHSIMARPGFKATWTRIVPAPIERSVYCLASALVLVAIFAFWHPILAPVWTIENPAMRGAVWGLFGLGWAIVFLSTWLINHFELFGLAQVWRHWRGTQTGTPRLTTPLFYRVVRHPLYSGFLLAFWAAPTMTLGHFLLAAGMTAYVLIAIRYEERDLIGVFGKDYEEYRQRVGMLVPGLGKRA